MLLGTAGAILSYALEMVATIQEFYQNVLNRELDSNLKEIFQSIQQQHRKIKKRLDRMRRENVTEMILEPIHNHDSDDYVIQVSESPEIVATARKYEETFEKFLRVSAEKVDFLPELSQMLLDTVRMIQRNSEFLSDYASQ
jgi:hypothetical protein